MYERSLYNRLSNFLELCNIIKDNHNVFKNGSNTTSALAKLSEYLYSNLDLSKPTAAVFLDLSKAFDCVDHKLLLQKLDAYGIRGKANNLLKDYLLNRKQFVNVNSKQKSDYVTTNAGVPQGSILGPWLFIAYINDLLIQHPQMISYADDMAVLSTSDTWESVKIDLNEQLSHIYYWLHCNHLALNVKKSVYITFSNYNDTNILDLEITVNKENLLKVNDTRYLGIQIDQNLRWTKHMDMIYSKLKYMVYVFYRLRRIMSTQNLLTIYYGLFNSLSIYGLLAWGGSCLGNRTIDCLSRLQLRVLKIINCSKSLTPLTIAQNYYLESVCHQFLNLRNKFNSITTKTRNKSIPHLQARLEIGKRCYTYTAVIVYNKLPLQYRGIDVAPQRLRSIIKNWIKNNRIQTN